MANYRANEPIFEPRRVISTPKPKKATSRFTAAKKRRLDPSYVVQKQENEADKKRVSEYSKKNLSRIVMHHVNRITFDPRFKKRNNRHVSAPRWVSLGHVKTCTKCKKELAFSFFDYAKRKYYNSPRKPYCFKCRIDINAAYYDKTKEERAERNRKYYEANKEAMKKRFKDDYERKKKYNAAEADIPKPVRVNK